MAQRWVKLGVVASVMAGMTVAGGAMATTAYAAPCGYYETHNYAYYNHCASRGYVKIRVDRNWPTRDTTQCVAPGITGLGQAGDVNFAWYTGAC